MRTKIILMLAVLFLAAPSIIAQTIVQPKIMVIPYTKEGEDIRTVLEADENKRIVLSKIKEAFDERGVSTIDFVAKLKAMESGNVFNLENKQDAKSLIMAHPTKSVAGPNQTPTILDRKRTECPLPHAVGF